jgi:hypothetical protein
LAGWNNNTGGQERGAGSQLSALALVKITGFASAQTDITRSPTDLTFANKGTGVSVDTRAEDPALGGSFNGSGYCANAVLPAATTTIGGPTYAGNPNVTGSQSVFVEGDVTITGNVKFGATPAGHPDQAPSFVLHATGNIKIAPGVTQLDGMYVSDKNIYTCETASSNKYQACKNQLLVHGSFVANQVKLQRTFGSLRDEEPNPPTPAAGQIGMVWSCGGSDCNPPLGGLRCIHTYEPGDTHTWDDNQICVPNSSPVNLAWTYYAGSPEGSTEALNAGKASLNYLKTHGYPYCTPWNAVDRDGNADPDGWNDNYLCSSQPGLSFSTNNDQSIGPVRPHTERSSLHQLQQQGYTDY